MSKKIILTQQQLINMGISGPDYYVRFRLISEDRNRFSSWSPIFNLTYTIPPG